MSQNKETLYEGSEDLFTTQDMQPKTQVEEVVEEVALEEVQDTEMSEGWLANHSEDGKAPYKGSEDLFTTQDMLPESHATAETEQEKIPDADMNVNHTENELRTETEESETVADDEATDDLEAMQDDSEQAEPSEFS